MPERPEIPVPPSSTGGTNGRRSRGDRARYPSVGVDPRELRPAGANRAAAVAVLIGLVIVVLALAFFA